MRIALLIAFAMFLLTVVPGAAQDSAANPYRIAINEKVSSAFEERDGRRALFVTVRFKVARDENAPAGDSSDTATITATPARQSAVPTAP